MFDADFNDFDETQTSRSKPRWAVVAPKVESRGRMKQMRGQGRAEASSATDPPRVSNKSRMKRSRQARGAQVAEQPDAEKGGVDQPEKAQQKQEPKDSRVTWLHKESEDGNIEYKLRLKDPTPARLEQLITQMKFRLSEGSGECYYYVGVEDCGYPRGLSENDLRLSLNNLAYMASALKSTASIARLFQGGYGRFCALVQVSQNCIADVNYIELRVAVGGNVGSGKSTLVSVLTHGVDGEPILDDGAGKARTAVCRHKHEIQTGHTSSISQSMLGYDNSGRVLNYSGVASLTAAEISAGADHMLHFIDLCGHPRYLKTALYGMTSLLPDFMMLCVSATEGVRRTTREHFAAALALDIPVLCVITKTDLVSPALLAATLQETRTLLATASDGAAAAGAVLRGASTEDLSDADTGSLQRLSSRSGSVAEMFSTDDAEERRAAQVLQHKLDRRVPVVDTEQKAEQVAQLMCIMQQHHHPLQCRSYMVPCLLTSSTLGKGIKLLHRFLSGLQQAPRRKQPLELHPRRQVLESYSGRVGPDVDSAWRTMRDQERQGATEDDEDRHHRLHSASTSEAESSDGLRAVEASRDGAADGKRAELAHFQVDHVFEVRSVGVVVSGTVVRGGIKVGDQFWWGPNDGAAADGGADAFTLVKVTSIHRSRVPVAQVATGQTATLAIENAAGSNGVNGTFPQVLDAATTAAQPGGSSMLTKLLRDAQLLPAPAASAADAGDNGISLFVPSGDPCDADLSAEAALRLFAQANVAKLTAANLGTADAAELMLRMKQETARTSISLDHLVDAGFASISLAEMPTLPAPLTASVAHAVATAASSDALPARSHTSGSPVSSTPHSASHVASRAGSHAASRAASQAASRADSVADSSGAPTNTSLGVSPITHWHANEGRRAAAHDTSAAASQGAGQAEARGDAQERDVDAAAPRDSDVTLPVGAEAGANTAITPSLGSPVDDRHMSPFLRRQKHDMPQHQHPREHPGLVTTRSNQPHMQYLEEDGAATLIPADAASPSTAAINGASWSPDAALHDSWHWMGLQLAGLPSNECDLPSPKGRKGTVLLDARAAPTACTHIDALMILINGQWPPRGLVSGRWPPVSEDVNEARQSDDAPRHDAATAGLQRQASANESGAETGTYPIAANCRHRSRSRAARQAKYMHILHCGSVRQAVQVVEMQELSHMSDSDVFDIQGVNMAAACTAAAVLLDGDCNDEAGSDAEGVEELDARGCLVDVRFQFTARREWVEAGARFLVRDQRGHISGVGVVRRVLVASDLDE